MKKEIIKEKKPNKLGLYSCITILIGAMFGSAIFSLSGQTIVYAGPASLISWGIAALVLLLYGLIVAELSSRYPKTGGAYVFPSQVLGKSEKTKKVLGWISAWGYMNSTLIGTVFSAIYIAIYLGVAFPSLANLQIPIAIGSCLICGILNIFKISITGKVNSILVIGLIITALIYVVLGLFNLNIENITPFFTQGIYSVQGIFMAIPLAMIAFGSVVAVSMMSSDVDNPKRTIPKATIISMIIITIIYLLIILTTVGLITSEYLTQNPGMQFIPLYAASWSALSSFPWLSYVISISATLALVTTMLVLIALTSRTLATVGKELIILKGLSKYNKKTNSPIRATIVVTLLSIIISCFPQFTEQLVSAGSVFGAVTIIINIVTLIVLRIKDKKNKKTGIENEEYFKAPGKLILPIIMIIVIISSYIPSIINGFSFWYLTVGWYIIGIIILLVSFKVNNIKNVDSKTKLLDKGE